MGAGCGKAKPFSNLAPVTIPELLSNKVQYNDNLVHIVGARCCSGKSSLQIQLTNPKQKVIRSPFHYNDSNYNAYIQKVTAKKQPKTSGAHVIFIPIFVLHATTEHFFIEDLNDPTKKLLIKIISNDISLELNLRTKIYNIEFDPDNPNDLYGGGKRGTRKDMVSIPNSGVFWKEFAESFDSVRTIQSKQSKYGFGHQRAVWLRSLRPGDLVSIVGRVIKEEKQLIDGTVVVVIELSSNECKLTNVDKHVNQWQTIQKQSNGQSSNFKGRNETSTSKIDEYDVINIRSAAKKWMKH
jgi:hypothetical protein